MGDNARPMDGTAEMEFTWWYVIVGVVLTAMALLWTRIRELPLTPTILFLLVGVFLGPAGLSLIRLDPVDAAPLIERLTEIGVIISLFTAGLKMRTPITDLRWRWPFRLATVSMVLTVGLIALAGVYLLHLPIGAAILLGAVLAPTDPVLASDVQVDTPGDTDRLRFSITGEAGLNDGTAFPFVMLGLGLLGLHDIGTWGWRWFAVDLVWSIAAGLGIGALFGWLVGRLILHLRAKHREAVGTDDYLSIGLLALAYGTALAFHSYGFLAAFAAGYALRQVEVRHGNGAGGDGGELPEPTEESAATHPTKGPAYMAKAVLGFNQQLERIGEVSLVILLGGLLYPPYFSLSMLWFVPLVLIGIRPLAVFAASFGLRTTDIQRVLVGWFGIRGIGSIYYLMFAIAHGLPRELAVTLTGLTFTTIVVSIFVHGISVTPLMRLYERRSPRATEQDRRPVLIDDEGEVAPE